jgi:hypothetical protein
VEIARANHGVRGMDEGAALHVCPLSLEYRDIDGM